MTGVNWGLLQQGQYGPQNALAMGLQMGQRLRQAKDEREYRNALSTVFTGGDTQAGGGLVATPEQEAQTRELEARFGRRPAQENGREEAMAIIAQRNPRLYMQMQQREQQAAQQRAAEQMRAQVGQWTVDAMSGDAGAREQLVRHAYDRWKDLDKTEQERVGKLEEQRGAAARYALNSGNPRAVVQQYVHSSGDTEAAALLQMDDGQLQAALRQEIFEAGIVGDLISDERPSYMAIPAGGTLVDTKNPQAISQFGSEQAPARVATPADYEALPPGAQYYDPEGNLRTKGGTSSNAGGGFPPG